MAVTAGYRLDELMTAIKDLKRHRDAYDNTVAPTPDLQGFFEVTRPISVHDQIELVMEGNLCPYEAVRVREPISNELYMKYLNRTT